jgi:hypothetical protein
LKKIFSDKKEREFKDEVDDIKYFLSVMSDMLADELVVALNLNILKVASEF